MAKLDKEKYERLFCSAQERADLVIKMYEEYKNRKDKQYWEYPTYFDNLMSECNRKTSIGLNSNLPYEEALQNAIKEYKKRKETNSNIWDFYINNTVLYYYHTSQDQINNKLFEWINVTKPGDSMLSNSILTNFKTILFFEYYKDIWKEKVLYNNIEINYLFLYLYQYTLWELNEEDFMKFLEVQKDINVKDIYKWIVCINKHNEQIYNKYN